ncbi:hypothetical protein DICPUDRAFT_147956 [Dictyostelium purpureum]|uniref:Uncharacterized protein n=1 Tax=Dictyostelium purpureum TaxID=5786 RepID=F0Z9V4_DICPU|nr:uncharacterized protein DICPUDRAFT_147956 [Dictyostelium purpureum]EGC39305.1 hypothetical protein DICPUDRAFT_147956 [Dictyostelium purpureum]|eukprot:XP_003284209.1 hypothetical protein DICPUDRAFT_147956 [Dictyostelium purpureum]
MNYELLLQKLNVQIEPLDRKSETFKTIENLVYKGQQVDIENKSNGNSTDEYDYEDENKPYRVDCLDIFTATRPSDSSKSFINKDNFKQSLLWYGCFNSSVAAKLLNGIQPQFTTYTNYRAVSLWDNILGCTDNINMGKFYKDKNGKYKPNKGILMLVEVNYKEKVIPNQIKIDNIKSSDYSRDTLNYNEDDDTEDESEQTIVPIIGEDEDDIVEVIPSKKSKSKSKSKSNNNNNSKKEKYVYCKEIKDEIGMNQMLQITGELSPNPNHSLYLHNLKIPNGPFIPSTNTVKGNGWINGYLKTWDKYNQFLIPSDKMIKLRYLVIVETRPTKHYKPISSVSPLKSPVKHSNNQNTTNTKSNSIWDNVLVKKRPIDSIDKPSNDSQYSPSFVVLDDDINNQKTNKKQKI